AGISEDMPIALVSKGTTDEEKTVVGTLADIIEASEQIMAPAVIVVGEVVRLRDKLAVTAQEARRAAMG
ncbi:MAG TPA: uroporphyrin-III C-methyltransferase, partial [Acidobacteriota bacterium]|nr:uroporphyrin-III C-methyltransferase [Acidobacteriota bacterium]